MRNLDAVALSGLNDGFAFEGLNGIAVEAEIDGFWQVAGCVHDSISYLADVPDNSSGKYLMTLRIGFGAA